MFLLILDKYYFFNFDELYGVIDNKFVQKYYFSLTSYNITLNDIILLCLYRIIIR